MRSACPTMDGGRAANRGTSLEGAAARRAERSHPAPVAVRAGVDGAGDSLPAKLAWLAGTSLEFREPRLVRLISV